MTTVRLPLVLKFIFLIVFCLPSVYSYSQGSSKKVVECTVYQKLAILDLLESSKKKLKKKLRKNHAMEARSRVLIRASRDLAANYAKILDLDKLPFNLVMSATAFNGCWAKKRCRNTIDCWDKHFKDRNNIPFEELELLKNSISKKELRIAGNYSLAYKNQ